MERSAVEGASPSIKRLKQAMMLRTCDSERVSAYQRIVDLTPNSSSSERQLPTRRQSMDALARVLSFSFHTSADGKNATPSNEVDEAGNVMAGEMERLNVVITQTPR